MINNSRVCLFQSRLLSLYLSMQTTWPHSHFHLWITRCSIWSLFDCRLLSLSISHLLLLDSLCPVTKNTGSLEVACSNGFLAFCFMLCSPARHLLLPAALGCVVTCSLRSFSSDRSNTLNRSSFARDSMMIEEILAPTKDTVRFHSYSSSSDLFSLLCLAPFHPLCPTFSSFSQSLITFSFLDILTVAVWFSAVFLSVAWWKHRLGRIKARGKVALLVLHEGHNRSSADAMLALAKVLRVSV